MVVQHKIRFINSSSVRFVDPRTNRFQWYGSDYSSGTSLDVLDVISANHKEIRIKSWDDEVVAVQLKDIVIV